VEREHNKVFAADRQKSAPAEKRRWHTGVMMKIFRISIVSLLIIFTAKYSCGDEIEKRTAVFNQQWLKALVSIEITTSKDKAKPIGTGFLVSTPNNHIALLTAKHVVYSNRGEGPLIKNLFYRLNDSKGESVLISDEYATNYLKSSWFPSKKYDLACRLIVLTGTADLVKIPYSVFLSQENVQAGAPLFIIGFPLGMRSEEYATPIVRRAMVARSDSENIIVDGFVFPGNSGGPVIYEPSVQLGKVFKTPILQGDWFIGMVVSEISYIETAISAQTGRARVTFEDNTGLCNVIPANIILDHLNSSEFQECDKELNIK
jgi:V8-like Glu-specific endopeptidase